MAAHLLAPPPAPPPTSLSAATVTKAAKAARDFEAMALGQLLEPMFNTIDTAHGPFGGGPGEEAFRPMLVNELAKNIAEHGGLGLAPAILAQMLRAQEARLGAQPGTERPGTERAK
jgi:peptidoglycan hydrolase FlgJ